LVFLKDAQPEQFLVRDDDTDYYGKKYWLEHQQDTFGTSDIYSRARNDLTERNLYWLKTLLKYRTPPAKVLELGCSHGSFVALLRQAGYDASGIEMSPWVVNFGQKTFGVPIFVGPVEDLEISPGSLDVIVLMDVLEHLPNPAATMARCLRLLKPDGLLLIQTPQFKEGMNYAELMENKARFLEMLIPEEHIYLFSDASVTRLFQQLGAEHIQFEPAIFSHYDMSIVVSRVPLQTNTPEQVDSTLLASPNGRFALAMLDLARKLQESESDRAARWTQIETLTRMVKESEVG
jgi:2-polyprenyl-3-methyl-5-hydroxy-6-metoxy-1,4-benzoquinol methylase